MRNAIRRFLEWAPLDYAGLFVATAALIFNQIEYNFRGYDVPLSISIILISILALLFIGRWRVPTASIYVIDSGHENEVPLDEFTIQMEEGGTKVDLRIDIPDHHHEVYLFFDIDGYTVGVEQPQHIIYDGDRAVIDYSNVEDFELTLSLTPNSKMTKQSATKPLKIIDKINNRAVCKTLVKG
ncbi:hypothetical protein VB773_04870 [Haloarculaceae archaeon H-GB2-1]|nr:hypothetical protein [Haloarculaceae archaeon H-GB1-1]MEA5406973.1 hypothetical protein [Haloarculaceae archaeon H-GB2-1]